MVLGKVLQLDNSACPSARAVGPIKLEHSSGSTVCTHGKLHRPVFLIMVCMAIYAVLVQGIAAGGDLMGAIWTCVGYTVLLCFVLFKTGSLSKSIWGAH